MTFGYLSALLLGLAVAALYAIPVIARWLAAGQVGRAALGLVAFAGLVVFAMPASAAVEGSFIGWAGVSGACTPGQVIAMTGSTQTGEDEWVAWVASDGVCPESGTVTCGANLAPALPGVEMCFSLPVPEGAGGEGAGGAAGVGLSLAPAMYLALGVLGMGWILFRK